MTVENSYRAQSEIAAEFERQGFFGRAAKHWKRAYLLAKGENRKWASVRENYCMSKCRAVRVD